MVQQQLQQQRNILEELKIKKLNRINTRQDILHVRNQTLKPEVYADQERKFMISSTFETWTFNVN
jgi:hypothetical protein